MKKLFEVWDWALEFNSTLALDLAVALTINGLIVLVMIMYGGIQ